MGVNEITIIGSDNKHTCLPVLCSWRYGLMAAALGMGRSVDTLETSAYMVTPKWTCGYQVFSLYFT